MCVVHVIPLSFHVFYLFKAVAAEDSMKRTTFRASSHRNLETVYTVMQYAPHNASFT